MAHGNVINRIGQPVGWARAFVPTRNDKWCAKRHCPQIEIFRINYCIALVHLLSNQHRNVILCRVTAAPKSLGRPIFLPL